MILQNWSQLNNGDKLGLLHHTRNVNFDKDGVIKLSNKAVVVKNDIVADGGSTAFEQVHSIESYLNDLYAITDNSVFKGDLDGSGMSDTTSSDLERTTSSVICYGLLHVVDGTEIDSYDGSSWTQSRVTGLNSGGVSNVGHPLAVFDSLTTHKLAVGDVNVVRTYNSSYSAGQALTLPEEFIVTSLAYRSGYLYVGTKTENGQEAKVFVWDGATANANFSVPVGASFVFALTPYLGTVAGITNEGELFALSGSQKVTLSGLPVYNVANKRWTDSPDQVGNVCHKGMSVVGDRIYFSVEADLADNLFIPEMIDGLWCYDPKVGLYHYASPTTDPIITDTGLTRSGNTLTTSADHNLTTGDPITFRTIGNLTGVDANHAYYAIVTASDGLQVAANRYDADEGNAITLGGTPNSSDRLVYAENADKGTLIDSNPGGVFSTNHTTIANEIFNSDVVFGAEPYNVADSVESTLQAFCNSFNVGWFETQKIYSSNITSTWTGLTVFLNGSLLSNESIVVKYRTEERRGMPTNDVTITWTDSDTFTTTDLNAGNQLKVGDEVTFLRGCGQGQIAHITSVSVASGTVTVNIDETYGTAAATGKAMFSNWTKLKEIDATRERCDLAEFKFTAKSSWIQFKVEMRGFEIEVAALDVAFEGDKRK